MNQQHSAVTRVGIEAARARGVRLGRPLNTRRDAEIEPLVAQGWGVLRIVEHLHVSPNVVRRVRDRPQASQQERTR